MIELLKELGCELHLLNEAPTGVFAHAPEPVPENLGKNTREEEARKIR